ncbi:MAG: Glu-tRNA(Gln) amidotransferase subunit GatE, partial [Ignavibacteriaceae bacterium]|nr:Glu-tRNA(Gln) amidotransferase subunit GatE [Ignavibacteriaceae bacterium]
LINENALDIALGIGMLYNCKLVDELHIARKQYLDGSIPTGFQRTAIYAVDGWIPYKDRTVKIVQMSIEEDSCREVSDQFHTRTYLTDRLGMPLIETVTGPDMRTPYEVAEVGWICAKLVRSTHKVRRGIGAARQDVNVSVEGGTRVEIKGVPKIGMIPLLTHNEAMRQWNLLRLREELRKRGITTETFLAKDYDITSLIKKPHYVPLKNAVESKLKIRCIVLKGFKDLLRWQTQTDTYFSKEISDRVRVIACLTTIPNLIHSDSRTDTITSSDWLKIKKHVEATDEDTIIIVWANDEDIQTAVNEIIIRAKEATIGIPSETRQALSDGTNGFERILPGADRMYPDTDLPPKKIAEERINAIKTWLPEQFWKRKEWYRKLKIPADTIDELSISKYAELFKKAVNEWNINPVNAAVILIQYPKRLSRSSYVIDSIDEKMMSSILKAYADKRLTYDFILRAMKISSELGMFVDEIIPQPMSDDELEKEIVLAEQKMQGMEFVKEKNANSILMGILMSKLRGRISAKKVSQKVGSLQRSLKNVK